MKKKHVEHVKSILGDFENVGKSGSSAKDVFYVLASRALIAGMYLVIKELEEEVAHE